MFLITRTVVWDGPNSTTPTVSTDYLGVADRMTGATMYANRLVKDRYGVQVEWLEKGWGHRDSEPFKANSGMVMIQICHVDKVNSRSPL